MTNRKQHRFMAKVASLYPPLVMKLWCICSHRKRPSAGHFSCCRTSTITITTIKPEYFLPCLSQLERSIMGSSSNVLPYQVQTQTICAVGEAWLKSRQSRWRSKLGTKTIIRWSIRIRVRRPIWIRTRSEKIARRGTLSLSITPTIKNSSRLPSLRIIMQQRFLPENQARSNLQHSVGITSWGSTLKPSLK